MKFFLKSFVHAIRGLAHTYTHEQNFKIEIFCAFIAIGFAIFFKINKTEWLVVIINIAIVLMAELLNTAIENLCNMLHKEIHPVIKIVKDVFAGAVVITALCAFVCGCIIFIPYILNLLNT